MASLGLMTGAIIYVIRNGLQWKDAPKAYGPHKTLYNRFIRWSLLGVFDRIFTALATAGGKPERIMIDATHLKAPPHRRQPGAKGGFPRCLGRTKGGLNSKLHTVCDEAGKPILLHLTAGQVSDHKGARELLPRLPKAAALLADRGYDSNWFRNALADQGTVPCIPPTKSRKQPLDYDKTLYRQRHKVA